ncbi:hypothetical protein [Tenacibaculum finnmarkense]|uniref:hypothetical protein n=1 Tax=Tenacibaculum finnmarkense TaxID=2781243 RepID=UPI00187B5111|nr:hypothetical protein [Tenacibaculum finnmarkense]MBE7693220.1 hypothetical protein [Tenacibaculum finnmarkense genomovar finnmarkense]
MKKVILCLLVSASTSVIYGQTKATDVVYRRSSLFTLMVTDQERDYADAIEGAFKSAEIPEKFNNHNIDLRTIAKVVDESNSLSKKELKEAQKLANKAFFSTNKIAKAIVAKWFNRSEQGGFNMDLISKRGLYNATELDMKIAKNSERGLALLADAGEELINNTFIVVNDFSYINKEEVAGKVKKGFGFAGSLMGSSALTSSLVNKTLDVAGKGYVIKTTSNLYKLVWDEETAAIFYNDYWNDDANINLAKKKAFEASDIFKVELIGTEVAWADLQSTSFTKKTEEELVAVATVKAVDAVIAKLQRKYEVFRTKTPLISGDPISAKIGLKEGLEKGDKYEVLEQNIDKNGKTFYKRKGVIKVNKKQIWDNRFLAGEEKEATESKEEEEVKEYTLFKGGKKYYSGMLIRQIN